MSLDQKIQSEVVFAHWFRHAGAGLAVVTNECAFLMVNESFCRMLGYAEHELQRLSFHEIMRFGEAAATSELLEQIKQDRRQPQRLEQAFVRKDGRVVWMQLHITISDSVMQHFLVEMHEISEQKRLEQQLREYEERFHSILENHPELVLLYSESDGLVYISPACERLTGYTADELLSNPYVIQMHNLPSIEQQFEWALRGEPLSFEMSYLHRDERTLYVNVTSVPIMCGGKIESLFCIVKDITNEKLKSEQLERAENLYHLISENSQDIITITDKSGIVQYTSPAITRVLGYKPEEVIGHYGGNQWEQNEVREFENSSPFNDSLEVLVTAPNLHKDGHIVYMENKIRAICDEQGEIVQFLAIARDITERLAAEEGYRRIVEDSPDMVIITRGQQWLFINEAGTALIGCNDKSEVMQKPFIQYIAPKYRDLIEARLLEVADGQTVELIEHKLIRADGSIIHVESKSMPTVFKGEAAVYTVIRDITERKKTQDLLINSEKLSVSGQLAAGIAHEIRNPLAAIKGFLQLMRSGQPTKQEYLEIISEEMSRIEGILSELLVLAKPQISKRMPKDIGQLIQQTVTLLSTQAILKSIEVKVSIDDELPLLVCDENQIKQVLINFIKNALEATASGGVIEVSVRRLNPAAIEIVIRDTGCGISKDRLARLGEPFYTTKEKGTGLGLMVSRRIIESHGGTFSVTSTVNVGTSVTLTFPIERADERIGMTIH
ncbi:PAS domain S-box protein [Paenibacillus sp. SN-8-1]|uniref:PAS domain-containing protein n=1 Tax=Paenibacillus sp. SN-8-1 TaxID=3435409 RepID=UPI003D9A42D5